MNPNLRAFLGLAIVLVLVVFGMSMSRGDKDKSALSGTDKEFLKEAASGGMMEVRLGQIATTKAVDENVQQFARKMVEDHAAANQQLVELASREGVALPNEMLEKHKDMIDQISKLNGAEFDKAYMDHMVKDHKEDVAKFTEQAKNGTDPDIKSFAANTAPKLEHHLQMAEDIQQRVG